MAGAFGRRRNVGSVRAAFGFGHEVSNPAQSVLKPRGVAPRAKVSTTRMRPAQQGRFERRRLGKDLALSFAALGLSRRDRAEVFRRPRSWE